MATKLLFVPHPAAPTTWDRETNQRIADRVARHTTGEDAAQLRLLVLRSKIDGPATKLALLLGTAPATAAADLQSAYHRLREDNGFNRLFHLIRGSL
jgi:hypothetical protein